jgi:hypothetical protein
MYADGRENTFISFRCVNSPPKIISPRVASPDIQHRRDPRFPSSPHHLITVTVKLFAVDMAVRIN